MEIFLDPQIAKKYNNNSQKIRIMSEAWVEKEIFCANCSNELDSFENNKPVADFYCVDCKEEFELKSKSSNFGKKIQAGAYSLMIERITSSNCPHFFFMNYKIQNYQIQNFLLIPNYFFTPEIIEKRKPLSQNARRAGWVGSNILFEKIPNSGKIYYIKDTKIIPKQTVLANWQKTRFLGKTRSSELKGWILDIMNCIDEIGRDNFSLEELYSFEDFLKKKHPNNRHIKDKIRQQLQFLRDKNYIKFLGRGKYQLI